MHAEARPGTTSFVPRSGRKRDHMSSHSCTTSSNSSRCAFVPANNSPPSLIAAARHPRRKRRSANSSKSTWEIAVRWGHIYNCHCRQRDIARATLPLCRGRMMQKCICPSDCSPCRNSSGLVGCKAVAGGDESQRRGSEQRHGGMVCFAFYKASAAAQRRSNEESPRRRVSRRV